MKHIKAAVGMYVVSLFIFLFGCTNTSKLNTKAVMTDAMLDEGRPTATADSQPIGLLAIESVTDYRQLPEAAYTLIFYGPIEGDLSNALAQKCKRAWGNSDSQRDFSDDFTRSVPKGCKAFRFPIVVILRDSQVIGGIPCARGLTAFYASERLAYCMLSRPVQVGDGLLQAGSPIAFDKNGLFRYPSETRKAVFIISAEPSQCDAVYMSNISYNHRENLGRTPISKTTEARTYRFECECSGRIQAALFGCSTGECRHKFTCIGA